MNNSWIVAACGSTELAEVLTPSLSEVEGRQVAAPVTNQSPQLAHDRHATARSAAATGQLRRNNYCAMRDKHA
ncbi:MAG: hypothetical protein WCL16_08485 [bacterium]